MTNLLATWIIPPGPTAEPLGPFRYFRVRTRRGEPASLEVRSALEDPWSQYDVADGYTWAPHRVGYEPIRAWMVAE